MENNKRRVCQYESPTITGESVQLQITTPVYSPACRLLIDTDNHVCILNDEELDAFESLDLHIGPDGNYFDLTYLTVS